VQSLGILVEVCCVRFRPPEAAARADWADQLAASDIFGPISSPPVEPKVEGRVVPARIAVSDDGSEPSYFFRVYPLGCEGELSVRYFAIPSFDRPVHESRIDDLAKGEYYYIPWQETSVELEGVEWEILDNPETINFLLLELVEARMCRFRRIGTFIRVHPEGRTLFMKPWGHEHEVSSYKYDETTGRQTIYIV
jgi:hypothetical protein